MLSEFSTKVKDFPDNYIQDFWKPIAEKLGYAIFTDSSNCYE